VGAGTYNAVRELYGWLPARTNKDARRAYRMRFSTVDREVEFLSEREAWAEDLMLGMRRTCGVELARFAGVEHVLQELVERGLVGVRGDHAIPTHDGWLLGNELFGALWGLADDS